MTYVLIAAGVTLGTLSGSALRDLWIRGERTPAVTFALAITALTCLAVVATGGTP